MVLRKPTGQNTKGGVVVATVRTYEWTDKFLGWLREVKQVPYEQLEDGDGAQVFIFCTRTGYINLLLEFAEANPEEAVDATRRLVLKKERDIVNEFLGWLFDVAGVNAQVLVTKETRETFLSEYFAQKGEKDSACA